MSGYQKIIAVSQRVDLLADRGEVRDAVDQNLIRWVSNAGYLPVPVPNVFTARGRTAGFEKEPLLERWLERFMPAGIVLSGGNNIGEFLHRDETEFQLMDWARHRRLPLLGICRGMQMMARKAGTELQQVDGHVKTRHSLEFDGKQIEVNSYHDYAVTNEPAGYQVAARLEDNVVEAIRHNELPWEGWMWHPEREENFSELDMKRFQKLIDSAS